MPIQGRKFVILGGAGFIGSAVAHNLVANHSADVVICDTICDIGNGKWANLPAALDDFWAPASLFANLDKAWREIAGVICLTGAGHETHDGDALFETAFHVPRRVWDYCAAKQRPLLWASSSHVYGAGVSQLSRAPNDVAALQPTTAFGAAKRAFDFFAARQGTSPTAPPHWAGLRLSSVYGKNEGHKNRLASLPYRAMAHAKTGTPLDIWENSADHTRDWVHVDDVGNAIAAFAIRGLGGLGGFFDIGTGVATSTKDLLNHVEALSSQPLRTNTRALPSGQPAYLAVADIAALKANGVSLPFRTLHEGLAQL